MQVNTSTSVSLVQPAKVSAAQAAGSASALADTGPSTAKTPLFSGGLINWSSLITPDTMRAMFELNSDGSVQTDGKGNPIRAPGEREDTVEKRFIYDHVQAAALNALGPAGVADLAGPGNKLILNKTATDEQKKFFHDVTGYNLESSGVFDDYGNLVPASGPQGGPVNAVWQLADKLTSNLPGGDDLATTSGDGVDKSKFSAFIEMMKKAKIAVPDSWLQKAKEYFDNTLDALNDAPDNSSKDSAPAKGENQSVT